MHQQIADIIAEFESAQARLHRLVDGMSPGAWAARPRPNAWSAGQCVVHLNLTGTAYVPLLQAAIDEGRRLVAAGTVAPRRHRRDPMGWLLSRFTGPLPKLGRRRVGTMRTTTRFEPAAEPDRESTVAEFDRLQAEQIALARAADGLPLGKLWIRSPFEERMRYNCYSCLVILPQHQLRHVIQAEEAARGAE